MLVPSHLPLIASIVLSVFAFLASWFYFILPTTAMAISLLGLVIAVIITLLGF